MDLKFIEKYRSNTIFGIFTLILTVITIIAVYVADINPLSLQANLVAPAGTEVEGFEVTVSGSNDGDTYTLSFSADITGGYDPATFIDGISLRVLFEEGETPSNPQTVNNSPGVLFDPVVFADIDGRKRATITYYDLGMNSDGDLFDFSFDYPGFEGKTVEISGEILTETENVYDLTPQSFILSAEGVEEEEEGGVPLPPAPPPLPPVLTQVLGLCLIYEEEIPENPFGDISKHYSEPFVAALYDLGIVDGYPDGSFRPERYANRAEMLKIAMETFYYDVSDSAPYKVFSDMDLDEWYAPYVFMAYFNGIVEGYDDGTFRPGNEITRAEALKMFMFSADLGDVEIKPSVNRYFADVNEGDWYEGVVETAYKLGVIKGYEDGTFGPDDPIKRGQASVMVMRLNCYGVEIYLEEGI